jgi:CheY-like chemotaxis protein
MPDRISAIAPGEPGATAAPSCRILLADDNRDAAESLGMLLQLLGSDVHTVYDGPSALIAVESYRPDVVLLDIGMPGMDGYEVARRIREQPERQSIPLIALTGWGQEEDRRRARDAGFDHHLLKPVNLDALQGLLATLGC